MAWKPDVTGRPSKKKPSALYLRYRTTEVPGRLARWVTQDTNDPDSIITVTLWSDTAAIQAWEVSEHYNR